MGMSYLSYSRNKDIEQFVVLMTLKYSVLMSMTESNKLCKFLLQ